MASLPRIKTRPVDLALLTGAWVSGGLAALDVVSAWAGHDEMEHAHVAWLIGQGRRPYSDFLENHLPGLWQLLAPFYRFFPGRGPEVLYWGRGLAVLSLAACSYLVYRIGVALRSRRAGLLAVNLWLPFSLNSRLLQIRPEMPCCPFLLASLLLPFARPSGAVWAAASGLCSGAAMYFTPRAYFFALGVFLAHAPRQTWRQRIAWLAGAAAGPLASILYMGLPVLLKWVVYFNGHLTRTISISQGLMLTPSRWIIIAAAAVAAGSWVRRSPDAARRVAVVYAVGLTAELLTEGTPFPQMYACVLPIGAALLAWQLLAWLEDGPALWRRSAWLVLLAVWAVPAGREWAAPHAFMRFEDSLFWQVREKRLLCRRLAGETVVLSPDRHPIGLFDASYYWYAMDQIKGMNPVTADCHFAAEIAKNKPALILRSYLIAMAAMDQDRGLEEYVRANYAILDRDFLVRKDALQRFDAARPGS